MKILHVGDIVGSPGRTAFARVVTRMKAAGQVDVVVANGENAAGGRGITPALAEELFAAGADVITLGDHTWDQKEILPYLDQERRIIRPGNFAPECPGRGDVSIETPAGPMVVATVIGRVFMNPVDCPFRSIDQTLRRYSDPPALIMVEIHAEATSEKIAMGRFLDGRVTSVAGTHTHVQTADEALLPLGTAYITDLGMTGPKDSVLGRAVEPVLHRFRTGLPARFDVATDDVVLEGVLITVNPRTGRAKSIRRVRESSE